METQVNAIYSTNFGKLEGATRYLAEHGGRLNAGRRSARIELIHNGPQQAQPRTRRASDVGQRRMPAAELPEA